MLRLSLRELLMLVALAALVIVSLRYASDGWNVLMFAVVATVFYFAGILAITERGPRQAFALGMIFHMGFYAALLGNSAVQDSRYLPTTHFLGYLHSLSAVGHYRDRDTGKEIPVEMVTSGTLPRGRALLTGTTPSQLIFMRIGHCWAALLLGYVGGRLVRFIYLWRSAKTSQLASESS